METVKQSILSRRSQRGLTVEREFGPDISQDTIAIVLVYA